MLAQILTNGSKYCKRGGRKHTVEVILQNILGVLLGLDRSVGIVNTGLMTADDLSVRHDFVNANEELLRLGFLINSFGVRRASIWFNVNVFR